jgi:general secretion pathway protein N
MTLFDPRTWIWIGWSLVSASLLATIGHELGWGTRVRLELPKPHVGAPPNVENTPLPDFSLDQLEKAYSETLNRPLFVPTRRPAPPPPPPAPPKPAMHKGQFVLMGVVITPETSIALLRGTAGSVTKKVEKGKVIDGITVETVEPEKVVLTQYGDREVLMLKVQPSPKGGAVTAGTPAVAGTAPQGSARSGGRAGVSGIESLRQRARELRERRRTARGSREQVQQQQQQQSR